MNYILKTGTRGAIRLNIVNRMYNRESIIFIKQSNLRNNHTIIDIGCGTGIMTAKLAKMVNNGGKVIALDQSAEQICIAKNTIKKLGLKNVEFIIDDAVNLEKYNINADAIYSRLFLIHQANPDIFLSKYICALKPGGIILCEEPITSSSFSIPISKAFEQHLELYLKIGMINKLDFDLGENMATLFQKNNLNILTHRTIQNTFTDTQSKKIALLRTLECSDIYLKHKLLKEDELQLLKKELNMLVKNSVSIISGVKMIQIIGQKHYN